MDIRDYIRQIERQWKEQDSVYHGVAGKFALSDTDLWVLYKVYDADDTVTQQELCRQGCFAKQTVNSSIARLSKNGYVSLEVIPGTRNHKKILLTAAGTELTQRTIIPLMEAEARAYGTLTREELDAYLSMTVRLIAALREETEKL